MAEQLRDKNEGKAEPGKKTASGSSKATWIVVFLMMALIGGLIWYNPGFVTDLFSGSEEQPMEVYTGGATSEVGFLSVVLSEDSKHKARVIVDGEILGPTPLKNRIVRAGEHRLVVRGKGGGVLMDQKIKVAPGEQKQIKVQPAQ